MFGGALTFFRENVWHFFCDHTVPLGLHMSVNINHYDGWTDRQTYCEIYATSWCQTVRQAYRSDNSGDHYNDDNDAIKYDDHHNVVDDGNGDDDDDGDGVVWWLLLWRWTFDDDVVWWLARQQSVKQTLYSLFVLLML